MRQTSANNKFLKAVKATMNAKIYARTVKLLNTPGGELSGGEKQALTYLQQFFTVKVDRDFFLSFLKESYPGRVQDVANLQKP